MNKSLQQFSQKVSILDVSEASNYKNYFMDRLLGILVSIKLTCDITSGWHDTYDFSGQFVTSFKVILPREKTSLTS